MMLFSDLANVEEDGVLVVEFDKVARVRRDLRTGAVEPFNAEQNALADMIVTQEEARFEHETTRAIIRQIIIDLQAEKARADEVINSPNATQDDKKNARAIKRTANAAIDLARFAKEL